MPRHKQGTIVRIKPEEVEKSLDMDHPIIKLADVVAKHGHIYTVVKWEESKEHGDPLYRCKSLASGEEVELYPYEITRRMG